MTPREIENKHAFNLIKDECLSLENDIEKFRDHLFAVGLSSIATTLGIYLDKTKNIRNYAVRDEPYNYTKQNTQAFTNVA